MLYLFEDYVLDTERRELRAAMQPVVLEPQVFDLLAYLIQNRERVVSKDDLIATIWNGRVGFGIGSEHPHQRRAMRGR